MQKRWCYESMFYATLISTTASRSRDPISLVFEVLQMSTDLKRIVKMGLIYSAYGECLLVTVLSTLLYCTALYCQAVVVYSRSSCQTKNHNSFEFEPITVSIMMTSKVDFSVVRIVLYDFGSSLKAVPDTDQGSETDSSCSCCIVSI